MINLVLDTETSGLGPKDGPCEIAMLVVDDGLNVIKEYASLIDPEVPISDGAYNVHGICDRDVYEAPTLPEYFRVVLNNVFDAEPIRLIAHNAPFDLRFVAPYLRVEEVVNTLHFARRVFPFREKHKLEILQEALGLPYSGKAHSALADSYTCLELVKRMCAELGTDFEGLMRYWHEPYDWSVMTWGKHFGMKTRDIPRGYRHWLLALADLDPQLRDYLEGK